MENVVALRGEHIPGEPVAPIVAELEELLDAARRGEVDGLILAATKSTGRVATFSYSVANWMTLLGAAHVAIRDLMSD